MTRSLLLPMLEEWESRLPPNIDAARVDVRTREEPMLSVSLPWGKDCPDRKEQVRRSFRRTPMPNKEHVRILGQSRQRSR